MPCVDAVQCPPRSHTDVPSHHGLRSHIAAVREGTRTRDGRQGMARRRSHAVDVRPGGTPSITPRPRAATDRSCALSPSRRRSPGGVVRCLSFETAHFFSRRSLGRGTRLRASSLAKVRSISACSVSGASPLSISRTRSTGIPSSRASSATLRASANRRDRSSFGHQEDRVTPGILRLHLRPPPRSRAADADEHVRPAVDPSV